MIVLDQAALGISAVQHPADIRREVILHITTKDIRHLDQGVLVDIFTDIEDQTVNLAYA